jgi:hypothetical protein
MRALSGRVSYSPSCGNASALIHCFALWNLGHSNSRASARQHMRRSMHLLRAGGKSHFGRIQLFYVPRHAIRSSGSDGTRMGLTMLVESVHDGSMKAQAFPNGPQGLENHSSSPLIFITLTETDPSLYFRQINHDFFSRASSEWRQREWTSFSR